MALTDTTHMEARLRSEEDGLRLAIREQLEILRETYTLASRLELTDPVEAREAERLSAAVSEIADGVRVLALRLKNLDAVSDAGSAVAEASLVAVDLVGDGLLALLAGHELA